MTEEELAEAADMSEKTIQRLRNTEPDNVTIETVMQLCIGMKLPPVLSACLLKASGKSFMMIEQHIIYQFLLNSCYHMSIFDCNEMLTAQGLKLLGRQNRVSYYFQKIFLVAGHPMSGYFDIWRHKMGRFDIEKKYSEDCPVSWHSLYMDRNRQIIMRSDIKLPQPFASWSNSL